MAEMDIDYQSLILKALSHPARRLIVEALRHEEQCVCHMMARFGFRQAYLSQQLKILREAGIVDMRRDGSNIYYRVILDPVLNLLDLTREMTGQEQEIPNISQIQCNCPKCNAGREGH